jgi:hypothetical protein
LSKDSVGFGGGGGVKVTLQICARKKLRCC